MRVLACPLASPGFLFPVVGLARRLRAAGHDVRFVTGAWARPLLRGEGLAWHGGGAAFRTRVWHDPAAARQQRDAVIRAARDWHPDVLLTSALALGPLFAGEALGRPVAVTGLLSPMWETGRSDWDTQLRELRAAHDRARSAAGLAGPGRDAPLLGDAWLRPAPPGRLPPGPAGRVQDVGPLLWSPPPPPTLTAWLPDEGAIYVQPAPRFGGPGFWRVATEALGPAPVAAATARMDDPTEPVPAPWFTAAHVSIEAVLPRARCIVASGTSTVAQGALRHGIPTVLLPGGSEHFETARLLLGEGVAEVLTLGELSPELLRAAVQRATMRRPAAEDAARRWNASRPVDPLDFLIGLT